MASRIGKVIDLWCTGIALLALTIIMLAIVVGTGDRGTIEVVCGLFGGPAILFFLVGKSVRFISR